MTYAQQTAGIIDRLSEPAQLSLLKFAKFLEADEKNSDYLPYDEAEMDEDIALYDAAKDNAPSNTKAYNFEIPTLSGKSARISIPTGETRAIFSQRHRGHRECRLDFLCGLCAFVRNNFIAV